MGSAMSYNILLVEDEAGIAEGIMDYMKESAITFTWAADGDEALALVYEHEYDLALLDVMLPGADGFEICRAIRAKSYVPIIFLTARGREEDRLYGYDLGCDDYVVKPFSMAELQAKIQSFLRRSKGLWTKNQVIQVGDIKMYPDRLLVEAAGEEVRLAPKEYAMLKYLMEHKGMIVTRDDMLVRLWGYDYDGGDRVVDNHVKKLRKALGDSGKLVKTVFAKGYRMEQSDQRGGLSYEEKRKEILWEKKEVLFLLFKDFYSVYYCNIDTWGYHYSISKPDISE